MRVTKKVMRPAEEVEALDHIVCDLCGTQSSSHGSFYTGHSAEVEDITVECRPGCDFGTDGGSVETTSFDLCPTCFKEILVPVDAVARCRADGDEKRLVMLQTPNRKDQP